MRQSIEMEEHILQIPNLEEQLLLLDSCRSQISWGEKGKGYASFIAELCAGESSLRYLNQSEAAMIDYREGVLRESNISCVYVYYQPKDGDLLQLYEHLQVFSTGQQLSRNFSWVSEKSLYGESTIDTAKRALVEELGLNSISTDRIVFRREIKKNDSTNTYPGLQSRITASDFQVELNDEEYRSNQIQLPNGEVEPGFMETQPDKTTLFIWGKATKAMCK